MSAVRGCMTESYLPWGLFETRNIDQGSYCRGTCSCAATQLAPVFLAAGLQKMMSIVVDEAQGLCGR